MNILIFTNFSFCQQFYTKNYTVEDGLAHASAIRIYQDKKGFIWFCTNHGLSRYDGRTFKNYSTAEGLSHNFIMAVTEQNEKLYISTYGGGIDVLINNTIEQLRISNLPKIVMRTVPQGDKLWAIGYEQGARIYEIKGNTAKQLSIKDDKGKEVDFFDFLKTKDDLIFTSSHGLYRIKNGTPEPYLHNITNETLLDVQTDKHGDLWLGLLNKVIHVKGNNTFSEIPFTEKNKPANNVDLLADHNGHVWLNAMGIGTFLINGDEIKNISRETKINSTCLTDLFEDKEGNIWFSTWGQGVYKMSSAALSYYSIEKGKLNVYCRTLTPSRAMKGQILVGSMNTLSTWANNDIKPIDVKMLNKAFCSYYIYFVQTTDKHLLIGTTYGIIQKELAGNKEEKLIPAPNGAPHTISACIGNDNTIWVGGYKSLFRFKDSHLNADTATILRRRRFNTIAKGEGNEMLFGTDSGLIRHTKNGYTQEIIGSTMFSNYINNIFVDTVTQKIWLATDDGLICKTRERTYRFTTSDGLSHNKCNILLPFNKKILIGTIDGLNYIDPVSFKIKTYSLNDYRNEILSLCKINNDSILIGTVNGLFVARINFDDVLPASSVTYITNVKNADTEIFLPKRINISYKKSSLTITFSTPEFTHPESILYRYKLEPSDNNWHYTKNTIVELSSVPSGKSKFILCTKKQNGGWGKSVVLNINVSTPLWKSWWFIAVAVVLFMAMIYITASIVIKRLVTLKEQKKREQLAVYNKIAYLKQQALSALINPHFIFNCMNSIQHFLNRHDSDKANMYLAEFAHLIRMTIENAQESFIQLDKEIERIKLYLFLEQLRFGNKLVYNIEVDNRLDIYNIRIPNMILQQYIENAIWHGLMPKNKPGQIDIRFTKRSDSEICISIQDDGIGIFYKKSKNEVSKNSLGMKLTEERLNLLEQLSQQHYEIKIFENTTLENVVCGTTIEVILPMHPIEIKTFSFEQSMN